jgi:ubiquitin-activating enzyme E1
MCTLRNFPNQIEHCIEYFRDRFNELFVVGPGDAKSYLENPKVFIAQQPQNTIIDSLRNVIEVIELKTTNSFESCVAHAKQTFTDCFDYSIRDLLHLFPADHTTKEGQPFWSGPKRCPSPIPFDINDERHSMFVHTFANLIALSLGIGGNKDVSAVKEITKNAPVKEYVSKKIEVKLEGEENGEEEQKSLTEDDEKIIETLT